MKRLLLATALAASAIAGSVGAASAQPMLLYGMTAKGHKTVPIYNEHPLTSSDRGSFVMIGSSAPNTQGYTGTASDGGRQLLIVENNRNGADSHVFY